MNNFPVVSSHCVMRFPPKPFALLALVVALFAGGCVTAPPRTDVVLSAEQRLEHNQRVFDRAWALVNDKFFDAKFRGVDWAEMKQRYRSDAEKAPDDAKLYGVINAMLGELGESHNVALSPMRRWEFVSKQRARIGIGLTHLEDRWIVNEVVPDSPAEKAGVQTGWIVQARNGEPLKADASFTLKEGETVAYDFLDQNDQVQSRRMVARFISTGERRESRELPGGAVYLRFDGFDSKSLHWMSEQLKIHRSAPAAIIDLRTNHGGTFVSLEFVMGEFFPRAVTVGTFIRRNGSKSEKETLQLFSARYPGNVILLTSEATASCAEILAHALRYHNRATLIGRPTAGAVVVSRFYSLPDGGMLQLAIEDFRGLDGKRLEGVGVQPDIPVALKLSDLRAGIDADLAAAQAKLHGPPQMVRN